MWNSTPSSPAATARCAADSYQPKISSISGSSSSFGIGAFGYSPGGTWLGATMYQVASRSYAGSILDTAEARNPTWRSWTASLQPCLCTASATAERPAICLSSQSPGKRNGEYIALG